MNIKENILKFLESSYYVYVAISLVVLGIIGIVFIFWPSVNYVFHNESEIPYPSKVLPHKKVVNKLIPKDNRLVIPKLINRQILNIFIIVLFLNW